jgi:hypothetical protein
MMVINEKHTGSIHVGHWLTRGWEIIESDVKNFLLLTLIYVALNIAASTTVIGGMLLIGPTTAGYFYILLQKARGRALNIGDIAKGFDHFLHVVLASLLIILFVSVGFFFFVIPGIAMLAWYMFAIPLIVEKKMDFWSAMETSRHLVMQHFYEFCVFALVLCLLCIAGGLLLGVGLLLAIPLVFSAIAVAYADIVGLDDLGETSD